VSELPIVAIVDSGVHAGHPHLAGARVSGYSVDADADPEAAPGALRRSDDFADRTGHGTAVAAALHRLAPAAPILAVRVLDADLRCAAATLAAAIVAAARSGARVLNLSLGSGEASSAGLLRDAVGEAAALGAVCVAAAHPRGRPLWPADFPAVISALGHAGCPLQDLFCVAGPLPRFVAHPYPRPVPGRAPADNLSGPSFAAVHVAARVAILLSGRPAMGFDELVAALRAECRGTWDAEREGGARAGP
jgi:hypothetical protein